MKRARLMKAREAKATGHYALTITYQLPREQELLERVLSDMRRGNIAHCMVKSNGGVEVWRKTAGGCKQTDTLNRNKP